MKKIYLQKAIIGFVVLATIFVFDFWIFSPKKLLLESTTSKLEVENTASAVDFTQPVFGNKKEKEQIDKSSCSSEIKSEAEIEIPFALQAPFANWDEIHNEACEEAVLIMAKYWVKNQPLTKEKTEEEIQSSVKWQEEAWGGHYDLNAREIVNLGREYFGLEKIYATKINDLVDIKCQISKGNLVLVPVAGRLLNNPYYRQPGPAYHLLAVKGYNNKEIITQDPGTRRGEDFIYSNEVFFQAIHDWPYSLADNKDLSKDEKAQAVAREGEKIMIVVEK